MCETHHHERGLNTDHIPIVTKLDITLNRMQEMATKNFRNVNWEKFREHLQNKLATFGIPTTIKDQVSLNKECKRLTTVLQESIDTMVPTSDVCPKSKRWWTKEIRELRSKFRKTGRKMGRYEGQLEHPKHMEYKEPQAI